MDGNMVVTTAPMVPTTTTGPYENKLSEEEIANGALGVNAVALYDVDHTASFLVPLQPEWWLPIMDDQEAFNTLQDEICQFVVFFGQNFRFFFYFFIFLRIFSN